VFVITSPVEMKLDEIDGHVNPPIERLPETSISASVNVALGMKMDASIDYDVDTSHLFEEFL
jgi:hypothetical protein